MIQDGFEVPEVEEDKTAALDKARVMFEEQNKLLLWLAEEESLLKKLDADTYHPSGNRRDAMSEQEFNELEKHICEILWMMAWPASTPSLLWTGRLSKLALSTIY